MSTRSLEKQSLEAHVDLCAERYDRLKSDLEGMNERLDNLEGMVKGIVEKLNEKENNAMRAIVKIAGSLIVTLVSALGGLIWYMITRGG